MKCCICKQEIVTDPNGWNKGNNAEPVKSGRCCNTCSSVIVLPERIRLIMSRVSRKSEVVNAKAGLMN